MTEEMKSKLVKILKDNTKWPLIIEGVSSANFPTSVVIPATTPSSELGIIPSETGLKLPSWAMEILLKVKKSKKIIVCIGELDEISQEEQEKFFDYCRKYYFEDFHGVLPIECPICQMQEFSMYDLIDYLSKKTNITDKEVLEYVKSKNKRRKRTYAIDHVNYALMKLDMTIEELKNEIRNNFKSYDEFKNHIRGV